MTQANARRSRQLSKITFSVLVVLMVIALGLGSLPGYPLAGTDRIFKKQVQVLYLFEYATSRRHSAMAAFASSGHSGLAAADLPQVAFCIKASVASGTQGRDLGIIASCKTLALDLLDLDRRASYSQPRLSDVMRHRHGQTCQSRVCSALDAY